MASAIRFALNEGRSDESWCICNYLIYYRINFVVIKYMN